MFFALIHKLGKQVAVISLRSDLGAWMVSGVEGTGTGELSPSERRGR